MLIKAPWNPAGHPGPSLRSSDHAQSASNPFISWIQLNALAAHLNQLPLGSALPSSVLSSQFIESPLTTILLSCACRPLPLCPPSHREFSLVPLPGQTQTSDRAPTPWNSFVTVRLLTFVPVRDCSAIIRSARSPIILQMALQPPPHPPTIANLLGPTLLVLFNHHPRFC